MTNTPYNDKERLQDALTSQKFATSAYNTTLYESATPALKNCLQGILNEEHDIQHCLWLEMHNRGWYPTECAPDDKLQQTKQMYSRGLMG